MCVMSMLRNHFTDGEINPRPYILYESRVHKYHLCNRWLCGFTQKENLPQTDPHIAEDQKAK